jgi:hypothetical protein
MLTLSQAVCGCIGDHFAAAFAPESTLGPANQVDFVGACAGLGSIRVELERRREDPVNNVVKAWRQAFSNPDDPPFTIVHVFSGYYSSRRAKMENARFVGERMCAWAEANGRRIKYLAIAFDFEPPSGDANPVLADVVAKRIRDQILNQLEEVFPKGQIRPGGNN